MKTINRQNPLFHNNNPKNNSNSNFIFEYLFNLSQISIKAEKSELRSDFLIKKNYSNQKSCRIFYKSNDNLLNQILQSYTTELVNHWEALYGFKIKTLVAKYIKSNDFPETYYIGTKQLFIMKKEPFEKISENGFLPTEEMQNFKNSKDLLLKTLMCQNNILEEIKPNGSIQVLSKKLMGKLAIEICHGDFCKYEFLRPAKEMLKPKKKFEYVEQNKIDHNQRVYGSEFGVLLDFI